MGDELKRKESAMLDLETLISRAYRGLLIGAEEETIRTQLLSEGEEPERIELAIEKAKGSVRRLCGDR